MSVEQLDRLAKLALPLLVFSIAIAIIVVCCRGLARGYVARGFGNTPVSRAEAPIRYWAIVVFGFVAALSLLLAAIAGITSWAQAG